MTLEQQIGKRVAEAVTRFKMIREGDRVAVGFSGGKDSYALVEALVRLRDRAPIEFSVQAFTIEQGKFLAPIEPFGKFLHNRGIQWSYHVDNPSVRLKDEQPEHGCDICSRYRRRAVYQVARSLGANVIALGHTSDDLCESFLRNALFNGRIGALPPVTWSRERDFRVIRPLILVSEEMTLRYAESTGAPVIPCGCSQKTGTVRKSLREMLAEIERDHPRVRATLLKSLGNLAPHRLLDPRYLDAEVVEDEDPLTVIES